MTPSELKSRYLQSSPDGHFFDRETMRHFGDTMRNFGVRRVTVASTREQDAGRTFGAYELYRKRPVKYDNHQSFYFGLDGALLHGVTAVA